MAFRNCSALCVREEFFLVLSGGRGYDVCMRMKSYLTLAIGGLMLASCVGSKPFTIRTTPCDGATVHINGELIEGVTPLTTEVAQSKDLGIVVEKEGYQVGSATIYTQTSWWRALLWTENDPKARYIEEDEVTIPMEKIKTIRTYTPTVLPKFDPPPAAIQAAPALHALPAGL